MTPNKNKETTHPEIQGFFNQFLKPALSFTIYHKQGKDLRAKCYAAPTSPALNQHHARTTEPGKALFLPFTPPLGALSPAALK